MTATAITSLGEVTELRERAKRRTYTVEYKLRIVKEAEAIWSWRLRKTVN